MIKFRILIICFLFCTPAIGQTYNNLSFEQINHVQGLLSDVVYSTHQDKNGFIWFSTSEGIVRYDGYEFRSFKNHPYLGQFYGMSISKMKSDSEGNIYICSNVGFYAFSDELEPILNFATETINGFQVNDFLIASNGLIYISTDEGFFTVNPKEKSIKNISMVVGEEFKITTTRQIVEDFKGRIWVGDWGHGVLKLNPDENSFTSYRLFESNDEKTLDNVVNSLFIDSHGFLWVGTWESGLFVLNISSEDKVNILKKFVHEPKHKQSIPGNIIFDLEEDKYNGIWLATPYGAAVIQYPLSKNSKIVRCQVSDEPQDISCNVVTNIFRDSSDMLWLATKGGGVEKLYLKQNEFEYLKIPELDPQKRTQSVHAFEKDHKGRLLVGVLSLGFVVYDFEKEQFFHYKDLPEYKSILEKFELNTVNAFLWDKDSVLWMGTRYHGIVTFDALTGKIAYINNLKYRNKFRGRNVNVLYLDTDASVWVGTNLGLNHISNGENNQKIIQNIPLLKDAEGKSVHLNVTGIVKDESGLFYVATQSHGIFNLDFKKGKAKITPWGNEKVPFKIISMFKDVSNRISIGTKGQGFQFLDQDSGGYLSPLPEGNRLGDVVYGINQDDYGSIWLTTNDGISKIWFQGQKAKSEKFLFRNGLQGNIFIPRAFFKDKTGHFFIGGHNGVNMFNPLKITGNYCKANVVITDVFIGGKPVPYFQGKTSKIVVDHLSNDFSVVFSSLSYFFPEANQYAYMLEGVDENWQYVSSKMRSASYHNLSAGTYVFKVKSSNSQGVWNQEPVELSIEITPSPFKTNLAIALYLILSGIIIGAIVRQRVRTNNIKQKLNLESIERTKSEKLHQYKLQFFTNISHELLTPLSILSSAIENSVTKKNLSEDNLFLMQRNVNSLIRLIRQLLSFRKLENGKMTLNLVHSDIASFVMNSVNDFNSLAEKRSMDYTIHVEDDVAGIIDKEKLEMILRNLLSNAFKYTKDGGYIRFSLKWKDKPSVIQIRIKDSGCGIESDALPLLFDRYYRNDTVSEKSGVGIGLNLTKSLVDLLRGTIRVKSEVEKGSVFIVELPVSEDAFELEESILEEENFGLIPKNQGTDEFSEKNENSSEIAGNVLCKILIIEDNEDFRSVLADSLRGQYTLYEASNGAEALDIAKSNDLDLIVSDVMMPGMSGMELCRSLKSNVNTSHIPIILLTAKVGDDNKVAGYEAGADSYIEKPFNHTLLQVRINALLKQRDQFKSRMKSCLSLEPENLSITSFDENFILQAKMIVEENISDSEFSVKSLAKELNASNSMLYRKMTSLVGLAPNEFIRNIRLKRAAQMLGNKAHTISEVAFHCGFNDLSYFGVCFKKMYGTTPTAYQIDEKNSEI
ncbi:two-component regulator propeller domain-containing protein [Labilibaculum sp.]|uniref:hybrid sensor histidine kinase/response regulator transcription factor n=1 Tax=Labilibaculum sp. TaxID=2060723 RepID=UPI003568CDDF